MAKTGLQLIQQFELVQFVSYFESVFDIEEMAPTYRTKWDFKRLLGEVNSIELEGLKRDFISFCEF